jgi:hypothetical protein
MLPLLSPTTSFSRAAFRLPFWLFAAAVWLSASPLFAGTTGKIAGTVRDAQSKEPLIGASVVVVETKQGAKSNVEGFYSILNVQPGTFTLRITYLGYKTKVIENVRVRIDNTTTINTDMEVESVVGEEVVIRAERPIVIKDQTFTSAVVSGEEIKALPVEDVSQVIGLQAGVVGGTFRGGRIGEVGYLVDGVSVTDVFDGNAGRGGSTLIDPQSIQELQVITGAFNAEYGQAMSGIVNVVTKEGGEKLVGQLQVYSGDYGTTRKDDLYRNMSNFSTIASPNLQASLSGMVPSTGNKLSFYAAGRFFENRGHLFGRRQYNTNDVLIANAPNNPFVLAGSARPAIAGLFASAPRGEGLGLPDGTGGIAWVRAGQNGSPIIDRQNGVRAFIPFDISLAEFFNNYENLGTGDNASVPLNTYRRGSIQGKLTYKPNGSLKVFYSVNFEDENFQDYGSFGGHSWQFNPDGISRQQRNSLTNIIGVTTTFSSSMFMDIRYSNFVTRFQNGAFDDPLDARYQDPQVGGVVGSGLNFVHAGTQNGREDRTTRTNQLRADLTNQINRNNLIKTGFDVKFHRLDYDRYDLRDFDQDVTTGFQAFIPPETGFGHDRYSRSPVEFAAYLQDKIEFESLIINVGLRFDMFQPADRIPRDFGDPSSFFKINDDSIYALRNGTTDRQQDISPKYAISPRIGVSFPITDRGTFYFSYGQFFQIPSFNLLYENALYKFSEVEIVNRVGSVIGNPDIGVTASAYIRDIRDLAGSAIPRNFITGGEYIVFQNADYGLVRGLVLTVNKRFGANLSFTINYTYQDAQGNASDVRAAAGALLSGARPETQLIALNWDQRHTLNGELVLNEESWSISLIGRYGSGFPYTLSTIIPLTAGENRFLQNATRRPMNYSFDVRATKNFKIGPTTIGLFLQVFNLFDTPNETAVFSRTGRATYDLVPNLTAPQLFNSIADFNRRPDFFSEPRRMLLGMNFNF